MESPLVTVIVPSYNHVTYVELAIQSVLRQTYPNIELIVIDDGSTDGSGELLSGLAKRHGFRLEIQANKGLSRTLNKGISLARGKYICPFGSDDLMLLDRIEKQVNFMECNPEIAVCGGNQLLIDSAGTILERRQVFRPYTELDFDAMFVRRELVIPASSAMIRKSVLDKEGGYDSAIKLEDIYLWLKLASRGYRIACLNDVLIYYRKHATNSYKNVEYMLDSMLKIYADYRDHPSYQQVVTRYLISAFLRAAKYDKALARNILRRIPLREYNQKIMRGLLFMLSPRRN